MKITTFTSLIAGATILSIFLAPLSVSQNSIKESSGTPAGWSDEIPLCDYTVTNQYCSIATNGNEIYVSWIHNYTDLVFSKSSDDGRTWSTFTSIYNNNFGSVLYDDVAVSGQNVHAVVGDFQGWDGIYYRNSTNGGETWNPVRRISSDGVNARAPHLFVNYSNLHIVWNDWRDGADGEAYYRRSLDGGITFDNGQGVNQDRRISFSPSTVTAPRIAGNGSNISVAWMDERNGDFDLYWVISKDNGFTWEDGLGHVGQDRRLTFTGVLDYAVAVVGSNFHIVWSNEEWPGPVYRLYYCNSTDNGVTWNAPVLLAGPNSGINSPNLDVVGDNINVVWDDRRDDNDHFQIYYKNSVDNGVSWTSDLRLSYNLSRWSFWPRTSVENDTKHVVWWDELGSTNHQVMYKRSPDFPADTSPPSHTNEIPFPDSYKDAPGTNVSVHVTDSSGVNESTIQLYVNGSPVAYTLMPITDGYNISWSSGGFSPGIVTCRIVADDNLSNHLDYTWNFTVLALYGIQLHEGWNLISVPLVQVNTSISEVLKDIAGKWDYIQVYNATDQDHWKTNLTYRPEQLNDLTTINHKMGFWINITEPNVNLTVRGNISAYTIIPLYAGWNFVGYPTQTTETVGNALWRTGADRVEVFDPTDPYRTKEVSSTYIMKPGEGYWVHVTVDSTWTINW